VFILVSVFFVVEGCIFVCCGVQPSTTKKTQEQKQQIHSFSFVYFAFSNGSTTKNKRSCKNKHTLS
jgi:hypothetical protein